MTPRQFWLPFLACFLLSACQRDKIQTYIVPKEHSAQMPPGMGMAGEIDQTPAASAKEISWKTPAGWEEQTPSAMRLGSFLVKDKSGHSADISVVPLSGDAGGDLANINRWRGQISLSPITQDQLSRQSETISPAGRSMLLVNFANQGKRLIAVIYHRGGRTWFFKMIGDDAVVANTKASFVQFLRSLTFHEDKNA